MKRTKLKEKRYTRGIYREQIHQFSEKGVDLSISVKVAPPSMK